MEFEEKRLLLVWQRKELMEQVKTLFPVGSEITWRLTNSYNETGHVVGHTAIDGKIRVRDHKYGFHTDIRLDDVLRATP